MSAGGHERAGRELVRMAVWAELRYLFIILVPLVPLVALGWFFLGPVYAACLGIVLTLTMWWGVQAGASEPEGESPAPQAQLHAWLDEVCTRLNAPRIDRIILTDELNAAAYQTMGLLSLAGTRRTLVLGVPLLRLMTEQEVRAVIAHEVGHFSREHGRLGHWVYLVRSKWEHYLSEWSGDGFVDSLLRGSASRFVPTFLERSSEWSIQCEYEADAAAAATAGARALADGLCRFEWVLHWLQRDQAEYLRVCRRERAGAPADYWDLVFQQMAQCDTASFEDAIQAARDRPRDRHETHPRLQERLTAVHVEPAKPAWDMAPCAGEALLGAQWRDVLGRANARWRDKVSQSWRFEHIRERWLLGRIEQTADAIAHAIFTEHLQRDAASVEGLRALAAGHPEHAQLQFELGMALLRRESGEGIAPLRAAIKLDRRLAVSGHEAILHFTAQHGTREEVERAAKRLANASHRRQAVMDGLWRRVAVEGQFWALSAHDAQLLARAFGEDPFLDGCWALQMRCTADNVEWPVLVLVPRVEFARLAEFGLDEDRMRSRYAALAQAILPPEHAVFIHCVLTTEPFYPRLLEKLQAMAGTCLVAPRTVINEGVLRIDSL